MSPVEWTAFQDVAISCRPDVEFLCDLESSVHHASSFDDVFSPFLRFPTIGFHHQSPDHSFLRTSDPLSRILLSHSSQEHRNSIGTSSSVSSNGPIFILTQDISEPDFGQAMERMLSTVLSLPAFPSSSSLSINTQSLIGIDCGKASKSSNDLSKETPRRDAENDVVSQASPVSMDVSAGTSDEEKQEVEPNVKDSADNYVDQALMSQIAAFTHPEHVDHVVERLSKYGNDLLQESENDVDPFTTMRRRHLARRLSEISPDKIRAIQGQIHQTSPVAKPVRRFLPFGTLERNQCLYSAFQSRRVSPSCGNAILFLENVRSIQHTNHLQAEARTQSLLDQLSALTFLYIVICIVVATSFYLRRKYLHSQRKLTIDILRAVYSRPLIKAAVEHELATAYGMSDNKIAMGYVPPLAECSRSKCGTRSKYVRLIRMIVKFTYVIFLLWILTTPSHVISGALIAALLALGLVAIRIVYVGFTSVNQSDVICTCCCCGVTTADVASGLVTAKQVCCSCCQGTGICSVSCAACCADGNECDDNCNDCCCDGSSSPEKCDKNGTDYQLLEVCDDQIAQYMKCCCCCGGLLARQAMNEKLLGCCADCCGCCSKRSSKIEIFEGVPIQIV
jgi:hypothetical protein